MSRVFLQGGIEREKKTRRNFFPSRSGIYEVNSPSKDIPFELYTFIDNKLFQISRHSLVQISWPEVENLIGSDSVAHVIPLCYKLQRFLTVAGEGDVRDKLVIHHRGRIRVVEDFSVDLIIRNLVISRCGRIFRIEPTKKIPLVELKMKIPKDIFKVYDVFDDVSAVLGKTDDHGSPMLVFTKEKKTLIDERSLRELIRESEGRSTIYYGQHLYLRKNRITCFSIKNEEPHIHEVGHISVTYSRQTIIQDFVRVFHSESELLLVIERNDVQLVKRYDRITKGWTKMELILLEGCDG
ncbi:uncharacterized protein LOC100899150 [Galendromus occidentalis]|uniref:Uncharacterized protein LOC100899150 n=1 Tax=Galendromus occidentalis TaxID=34638 RepID=A0AAJ6VZ55_9ACAR|nr:uncharacterized protein LOC100899150 [Galendromus occidentalis]